MSNSVQHSAFSMEVAVSNAAILDIVWFKSLFALVLFPPPSHHSIDGVQAFAR